MLDPIPELDRAMDALAAAADLLLRRDRRAAREIIAAIDEGPLREYWYSKDWPTFTMEQPPAVASRGNLRGGIEAEVLRRDGWRCRYCAVRIIGAPARKRFVELAGRPRLWGRRDLERHAALLCMSGNADHVQAATSFADPKASDDLSNLVACCWVCNFGKMSYTLDALGLHDPRDRSPIVDDWDGLTRLLKT